MADLESALARESRVSLALQEVGLALGTTLELDELLELILSKLTDALEADRATLYLLDETTGELVSRLVRGHEVRSIRLRMGQGIAGHVARTGRPLRVRDAYKDPRFNHEWDLLSGYRTQSVLASPMKNHLGRPIGVVEVLNKRVGDFTETDAVILGALSTQAAVSIDNSRLFLSVTQKNMQLLETKELLERRVRDLKLLFDLERAMGHSTSLEELFLAVLGEAMRSGDARAAAVALRDGDLGDLTLHIVDDRHKRLRRFPVREGHGLIGHAVRYNETIVAPDAAADERNETNLDKALGFPTKTVLAVPFEGEDGQCLGAIALYNKRGGRSFTDDDRELLTLISANASTAIRLQLARETREREERMTTIGRLLSGVLHDLKTPLTVIRGYVQWMQKAKERGARNEYAALILKQFDHIGAMQREVLEFARGEKNLLVRRVYLATFFADVRQALEQDLSRHNVELSIDLQDKGTARFDEGKMMRVIHNLARNATDAMQPKGGRFDVKVVHEDDVLVMTFTDTGPGIPKSIEHRLFQSFVTSGKQDGTGLGLAIVKKIAEEHGGSISVSSTRRGATFRLCIPQHAP